MVNCDSAVAGFDTDIDVPGAGKKMVFPGAERKGEAGVMLWVSRLPRGDYVIKCRVQNQWGIMSS